MVGVLHDGVERAEVGLHVSDQRLHVSEPCKLGDLLQQVLQLVRPGLQVPLQTLNIALF